MSLGRDEQKILEMREQWCLDALDQKDKERLVRDSYDDQSFKAKYFVKHKIAWGRGRRPSATYGKVIKMASNYCT